jgi:hypothetical protein
MCLEKKTVFQVSTGTKLLIANRRLVSELFHFCFVLWLKDHCHVLYINYDREEQEGTVKGRTFAG